MDTPQHVVFWKIRCIDRKTKKFFDRLLVFDGSDLSGEDRARFYAMIKSKSTEGKAYLDFRSSFVPCDAATHDRLCSQAQQITAGGPHEYFEDEDCRPIDRIEIAQILTDAPDPILRFEPQSVLRFGPSALANRDQWTVDKANNISHFLQLVNQIGQSKWLASKLSIEYSGGAVVRVAHPDAEMTTTALTYVRQMLLKRDDVFNHACDAYVNHIKHEGRRAWVADIHGSFNAYLESDCSHGTQVMLTGLTARQAIDIFTYGSGLFHRQSNEDCESKLADLIAKHGRERLVFAFNSTCRSLLQYIFFVAPVMWQDVAHWVRDEGCVGPDRPRISDLFGG